MGFNCFINADTQDILIPIIPVTPATLSGQQQDPWIKKWLIAQNFHAKPGQICCVPEASNGELSEVLIGVNVKNALWSLAGLPAHLPPGNYQLLDSEGLLDAAQAALGFGLACYRFDRYKKMPLLPVRLALEPALLSQIPEVVKTLGWVRDLINTPAEDMGPEHLSEAARELAEEFAADFYEIIGEDLLAQQYPAIHCVGRAAARAPRLIDVHWGNPEHPKITLVGKGVCFDSGGLDIKDAAGMLLMRKDMGGAAHALGLARLVMSNQLPVRLRVLIPAVENAIAGNAYRPGDIVPTRKGLTIEIGNTDAEGRVILADALYEACQDKPELLIDFATLTGAARVALGPELPACYSNYPELAMELMTSGMQVNDPVWHMPLYTGYRELIESPVADLSNSGKAAYAGSIIAALFLEAFVDADIPWLHFDFTAWNLKSKPGRPEGAEAMGLRALWFYLSKRFGGVA